MKTTELILLAYTGLVLILPSCSKSDEQPQPACDGSLTLNVVSVSDSDCGEASGSITVSATGGNGNNEYRLNQGGFQVDGIFDQVGPGFNTITVRDGNNCTVSIEVLVMSGVLIADIRPIINTNCAVPDCHDGSDPSLPDWTDDNALRGFASLIKTRTANREMPPSDANTMLTDEEIELIGCWVDDGAN